MDLEKQIRHLHRVVNMLLDFAAQETDTETKIRIVENIERVLRQIANLERHIK